MRKATMTTRTTRTCTTTTTGHTVKFFQLQTTIQHQLLTSIQIPHSPHCHQLPYCQMVHQKVSILHTSRKSMFEFLARFEFLAGARAGRESRGKNKGSGWKFLQPLISGLIKSYQKCILQKCPLMSNTNKQ